MGKISQYTRALKAKLSDLFVVASSDNGSLSTKAVTTEQIGDAVITEQTFSGLDGKTPKEAISDNTTNIGDLSTLTTTVKSSIVGAVNEIARYTPVYGNTASGAIATFDTSLALPLQNCTIAINAVQEGSGTPSPDNVRPITGFTGANIHVADDENPHVIDNVTAISWQSEAGTVYGGSLDVTSGVLTITHGYHQITGTEEWQWNKSSSISGSFSVSVTNMGAKASTPFVCSHAKTVSRFSEYEWGTCYCGSALNFRLMQESDTVQDWTNYLASQYSNGTPVTICFELATPQTYQLTPTEISAIVGTNNVFTDTNGDTSVVYACSLKDYIEGQ